MYCRLSHTLFSSVRLVSIPVDVLHFRGLYYYFNIGISTDLKVKFSALRRVPSHVSSFVIGVWITSV